MGVYISNEIVYDEILDKAINKLIYNAVDVLSICKKARIPIGDSFYGHNWYYYREEFMKISDALNLMEHDAHLLLNRVTKISEVLWDLYKKKYPNTPHEAITAEEVNAMRNAYFEG